jgi:hypothetical protein
MVSNEFFVNPQEANKALEFALFQAAASGGTARAPKAEECEFERCH